MDRKIAVKKARIAVGRILDKAGITDLYGNFLKKGREVFMVKLSQ
ncbi:MAG: hypothetical protein QW071_05070 [Candidatus Bathyarchaeia archaeon]